LVEVEFKSNERYIETGSRTMLHYDNVVLVDVKTNHLDKCLCECSSELRSSPFDKNK